MSVGSGGSGLDQLAELRVKVATLEANQRGVTEDIGEIKASQRELHARISRMREDFTRALADLRDEWASTRRAEEERKRQDQLLIETRRIDDRRERRKTFWTAAGVGLTGVGVLGTFAGNLFGWW